MKKTVLFCICFCLFLGFAAADNTEQSNDQIDYPAENDSMGVRIVGPLSPMAAPSEHQQAVSLYNLGTSLMRENRLEEAEKYLKEAIDLDPLFVDVMDHLGSVYRRQNRLPEAEAMYLRSIEINKENKVPYINLAVVYKIQNRLNEALQLYVIVIQLDQNDPEGYYGIGEIFYLVGNYQNAMPFFDKAIELYLSLDIPYVYDAYYYKGMMYFRMEEYDEALIYLLEARKGNPNNATLENTINEILKKTGI